MRKGKTRLKQRAMLKGTGTVKIEKHGLIKGVLDFISALGFETFPLTDLLKKKVSA